MRAFAGGVREGIGLNIQVGNQHINQGGFSNTGLANQNAGFAFKMCSQAFDARFLDAGCKDNLLLREDSGTWRIVHYDNTNPGDHDS